MPVSSKISYVQTELARDGRQEVEGDGRSVELTAAVVGQHQPVHAELGDGSRVVEGLNPLDHQ